MATCLCCSVDEAVMEDQQSDPSPSSVPDTEVQSTPGQEDQDQNQEQKELEDGLSDLHLKGKTSQQPHEEKVQCFLTMC